MCTNGLSNLYNPFYPFNPNPTYDYVPWPSLFHFWFAPVCP
jgi:hypothetical protein